MQAAIDGGDGHSAAGHRGTDRGANHTDADRSAADRHSSDVRIGLNASRGCAQLAARFVLPNLLAPNVVRQGARPGRGEGVLGTCVGGSSGAAQPVGRGCALDHISMGLAFYYQRLLPLLPTLTYGTRVSEHPCYTYTRVRARTLTHSLTHSFYIHSLTLIHS